VVICVVIIVLIIVLGIFMFSLIMWRYYEQKCVELTEKIKLIKKGERDEN